MDFDKTKIEAFLKNELSEEERIAFQEQIDKDPALAAEVELIQVELEVMNEIIRSDLEKQMALWDEERTDSREIAPTAKRIPLWRNSRVIGIAASIALLISAAAWAYYTMTSQPDPINNSYALTIPVYNQSAEELGYALNERTPNDSMSISINPDTEYAYHYRFMEDLELFITPEKAPQEVALLFNAEENQYTLLLDSTRYKLDYGFSSIKLLNPEN